MVVELPAILQVPPKLLPLITDFNSYDYFLIDGGRGGGKTNAVARWLLYCAEKKFLRIVCGRELQINIRESVYSIFTDLIIEFHLNFDVAKNTITHRETKTEITFRGFREQGIFNVQGMEGVDILWIDEAQGITKLTLEHLIPTIRKDNSKVIFTMNRFIPKDPVYATFEDRDDCKKIHLNYSDNPFCTNKLLKEAIECKRKSEDDFNHIWLGQPVEKTEDSVFTRTELDTAKRAYYAPRQGYGYKIAGFDIARFGDDKCAGVIIQQMGALHWSVVFTQQWDGRDTNWTAGEINKIYLEQKTDTNIIDCDGGYGAGPYDQLSKGRGLKCFQEFHNPNLSFDKNRFYGNNRTANTYKLKDMLLQGHLHIKDEELLEELFTLRYEYDHNQRKRLVSKEDMRSKGIKSPNLADALIMAASLIEEVKTEQERAYGAVRQTQRQDDNLFQIAGVR